MGSDDSRLKRFLRSLPGRKPGEEDQGNSYEFEATIGKKGNSLGITFNSVAQALASIRKGMKARVIMIREPGSSIFTARIIFQEAEEGKKAGSGVST